MVIFRPVFTLLQQKLWHTQLKAAREIRETNLSVRQFLIVCKNCDTLNWKWSSTLVITLRKLTHCVFQLGFTRNLGDQFLCASIFDRVQKLWHTQLKAAREIWETNLSVRQFLIVCKNCDTLNSKLHEKSGRPICLCVNFWSCQKIVTHSTENDHPLWWSHSESSPIVCSSLALREIWETILSVCQYLIVCEITSFGPFDLNILKTGHLVSRCKICAICWPWNPNDLSLRFCEISFGPFDLNILKTGHLILYLFWNCCCGTSFHYLFCWTYDELINPEHHLNNSEKYFWNFLKVVWFCTKTWLESQGQIRQTTGLGIHYKILKFPSVLFLIWILVENLRIFLTERNCSLWKFQTKTFPTECEGTFHNCFVTTISKPHPLCAPG